MNGAAKQASKSDYRYSPLNISNAGSPFDLLLRVVNHVLQNFNAKKHPNSVLANKDIRNLLKQLSDDLYTFTQTKFA